MKCKRVLRKDSLYYRLQKGMKFFGASSFFGNGIRIGTLFAISLEFGGSELQRLRVKFMGDLCTTVFASINTGCSDSVLLDKCKY